MTRKLVLNIADVHVLAHTSGHQFGLVSFESRGRVEDQTGTESMRCAVKVVQPGGRCALFSAMHYGEEMGIILSGTGRYDVAVGFMGAPEKVIESFSIREGDLLLAPEGNTDAIYHIVNTGAVDLKLVAFQSRRHIADLAKIDAARVVIDSYIERRWRREPSNSAGYEFDGRVLTAYLDRFRLLVTFDQLGTIWANGSPLTHAPNANIESRVDQLLAFEKAERLKHYEMHAG